MQQKTKTAIPALARRVLKISADGQMTFSRFCLTTGMSRIPMSVIDDFLESAGISSTARMVRTAGRSAMKYSLTSESLAFVRVAAGVHVCPMCGK